MADVITAVEKKGPETSGYITVPNNERVTESNGILTFNVSGNADAMAVFLDTALGILKDEATNAGLRVTSLRSSFDEYTYRKVL